MYQRLTDEALLSRCARCLTQNANESLHSVIWSKCPKEIFVSRARVETAASIAVCEYNLGTKRTVIELLQNLGLSVGQITLAVATKIDKKRLNQNIKKATEKYKNSRRIIAAAQNEREKSIMQAEGPSYGPGMF